MAILSFEFDQLFKLLVPELVVVVVVGSFSFPSEPDFVQEFLSINSHFVILLQVPLNAKRLVLLVPSWHHAIALLSFKLDKLFTFHIPLLIKFRHGSQLLVLLPFGFRLRCLIV
jgi:hypothetical protein